MSNTEKKDPQNGQNTHRNALFCTNAITLTRDNIDATSDEKFIKVSGLVCHFDTINENREIVNRNSFDKFFEKLKNTTVRPTINVMHGWNASDIIGGWDLLRPDEKGLYGEGRICKIPFVTDHILPLMESGFLSHFSTEGYVTEWRDGKDEKGYYYIADNFELLRVSLVDIPADLYAAVRMNLAATNAISLIRDGYTPQHPEPEKTIEKTINGIPLIF